MTEEARELHLWLTSERKLWPSVEAYYRNLERHKARGKFDAAKAVSGLAGLMREAAKEYGRQHCTGADSGLAMFSPVCRLEVAAALVADFECEYEAGNRWGKEAA